MMKYVLYVQIDGQWVETSRFEADDNVDAFQKTLQRLDPAHRGLPLAFAPVESAGRQEARTVARRTG